MLEKLLRLPLPEQIVALLEKLEQNPDTSHLRKVENLLDYYETNLTRYEEWVIKRNMRRVRNVIRRDNTLNDIMSIVVDRPTRGEERAERLGVSTGTGAISGTLSQHAAAQQAQIAHISAHQQLMMQQAKNMYSGLLDPRGIYTNGSSQ